MKTEFEKFKMACAICGINVGALLEAFHGVNNTVFNEVRDNILQSARRILKQQPGDPLTPRMVPRPRRVRIMGHTIHSALIWKSRLSGKPGRIKILKG